MKRYCIFYFNAYCAGQHYVLYILVGFCNLHFSVFVCLFVCLFVCFGFNVAFKIIRHITTVSGCDRELNAHFYSAASLWYQIPDTFT